jgi:Arc/MetJ-type ribon-helix-helix transcriptional regulator
MQITLPAEAQAIIEREIESGRYATREEVIVDALKHLDDVPYVDDDLLVTAREQADRGEVRPLTEELMQELSVRARDNARLGKPIRDDVKY